MAIFCIMLHDPGETGNHENNKAGIQISPLR